MSDERVGPVERSWLRRFPFRLVAIVGLAVVLLVAGRRVAGLLPQFTIWVQGLGPWGPLAFVLSYVVACVTLVPGSLLTLAAGAVFGVSRGFLYVFAGATLGASAAFLIARYVARDAVERRLAGNVRLAAIDRAIAREGRRIVTLLRLSPVVPFNLLNYALGLTKVRFLDYLVAMVGIAPGTLLYVYSGRVVGDVAALVDGAAPSRGAAYYGVLAVGLAATIAVTAVITRAARRALREAAGDAPVPANG